MERGADGMPSQLPCTTSACPVLVESIVSCPGCHGMFLYLSIYRHRWDGIEYNTVLQYMYPSPFEVGLLSRLIVLRTIQVDR